LGRRLGHPGLSCHRDPSRPAPARKACALGPYGPDHLFKHTSCWAAGLGVLASLIIGILPALPQPVGRARLALTGQIFFLNTPPVGPPAWNPGLSCHRDPSCAAPACRARALGPYGPDPLFRRTSCWAAGLGTLASLVIGILPALPQPVGRARLALTGQILFLDAPPVGPPAWEPWPLLSSRFSCPAPACRACAIGPYGPDLLFKHTSCWAAGLGTLASLVIGILPALPQPVARSALTGQVTHLLLGRRLGNPGLSCHRDPSCPAPASRACAWPLRATSSF
jgi:hypothetical protein